MDHSPSLGQHFDSSSITQDRTPLPAALLDTPHAQALARGLQNLLSTGVVEFTLAQIIDAPVAMVALDTARWMNLLHPICLEHVELCPGTLDTLRQMRASMTLSNLQKLSAYLETAPGTPGFHLRLIEMVATACHDIAVLLHQRVPSPHTLENGEARWRPPPPKIDQEMQMEVLMNPSPTTLMYHRSYTWRDQYPSGESDVVAYWAETRIFGGVVLFDRGSTGTECNAVYLHASQRAGPSSSVLFKLDDSQVEDLAQFFLSESLPESRPFPFFPCDCLNPVRVEDCLAVECGNNIWRDKWERQFLPPHPLRASCKVSPDDGEFAGRIHPITGTITACRGPADEIIPDELASVVRRRIPSCQEEARRLGDTPHRIEILDAEGVSRLKKEIEELERKRNRVQERPRTPPTPPSSTEVGRIGTHFDDLEGSDERGSASRDGWDYLPEVVLPLRIILDRGQPGPTGYPRPPL